MKRNFTKPIFPLGSQSHIKKRTLYNRRNSSRRSANTCPSQRIESERCRISDLLLSENCEGKQNREQLEKRNLLIGYLLYTTGLRASELLSLNWGSFRYNRQGSSICGCDRKGKKPRTIPIKEETIELLFDYRKSLGESVEINPEDTSPLFFTLIIRKNRVNIKNG